MTAQPNLTIAEGNRPGAFLFSESRGCRSRDEITIAEGNNLVAGTVLGKIRTGVADAVANDNTGDGAIEAITVGYNAIAGFYVLKIVAAAADAGIFHLFDPDGDWVGEGTVGTAFASTHLSFILEDGTVDFDVGDTFTIEVSRAPGQYVACAPNADDGSQVAAAILWDNTNTMGGAKKAVGITRHAEVNADELVWPADMTDTQREIAIAQLAGRKVIVRSGY